MRQAYAICARRARHRDSAPCKRRLRRTLHGRTVDCLLAGVGLRGLAAAVEDSICRWNPNPPPSTPQSVEVFVDRKNSRLALEERMMPFALMQLVVDVLGRIRDTAPLSFNLAKETHMSHASRFVQAVLSLASTTLCASGFAQTPAVPHPNLRRWSRPPAWRRRRLA